MTERSRRGVFMTLFALALASAVVMMASSLSSEDWQVVLLATGGLGALVFGAACAILAWRWWGGGRPDTL